MTYHHLHFTTEKTKPQADENDVYRSSVVYAGPRPKPSLGGGKPSAFSAMAEILPLKFPSNQKSRGGMKFVLKLLGSPSMQRKLN